jgi:hypothetical protein
VNGPAMQFTASANRVGEPGEWARSAKIQPRRILNVREVFPFP